jgi:type IV pilus assembly protein PilA
MDSRKRQQGFSLIELLIVVAIILIIAAIAIPNLMHSRMAANESAAVGALRTLNTGEITYYASCPDVGFSSSIQELNTGTTCQGGQGIIDEVLASGAKSGYVFTYAAAPDATGLTNTYTLTAVPGSIGVTGQRGFYTDQTGVLRYDLDGSAPTNASSALQ